MKNNDKTKQTRFSLLRVTLYDIIVKSRTGLHERRNLISAVTSGNLGRCIGSDRYCPLLAQNSNNSTSLCLCLLIFLLLIMLMLPCKPFPPGHLYLFIKPRGEEAGAFFPNTFKRGLVRERERLITKGRGLFKTASEVATFLFLCSKTLIHNCFVQRTYDNESVTLFHTSLPIPNSLCCLCRTVIIIYFST